MLRFLLILLGGVSALGEEFIAGVDLSHLAFFEGRGGVYRDAAGETNALKILAQRGVNCARLRLFTSTAEQATNDPYNFINNLDYTLPLARRVKEAGLKFLLDFHYSDSWADPGKQRKPAAWTNLNFLELEAELRRYSSNTVAAFKGGGAMPDFVQVGNEISVGMLFPEGRVGSRFENAAQWSQLGRLLKAAIGGVEGAAGAARPKIIIHIDRGGDWNATRWYFDKVKEQEVAFDIIGQSYYPFWHGTLGAFEACLTNAASRFGKPVFVMETAFPWTNSAAVQGIAASPEGQVDFTERLGKILKSAPEHKGAGVFWWAAEYLARPGVPGAGFEARSFFDFGGHVLPVAGVFGALSKPSGLSVETAK